MKEIDFLPGWYKDKRQSQSRYRIQYAGLAMLVAAMATWTVMTVSRISTAHKELEAAQERTAAATMSSEYQKMKAEFERLNKQNATLLGIGQHLKASAVLGEFSVIAGENIKLSRMSLVAERFRQAEAAAMPTNAIRAVRDTMAGKSGSWEGDIRFKVTFTGIATDSTCVAELVGRLERSPWFAAVTPSYCKNGTVGEHTVSEFEITCYVNNYTEGRKPATAGLYDGTGQDTSR